MRSDASQRHASAARRWGPHLFAVRPVGRFTVVREEPAAPVQVAARPDATPEALQAELAVWDEQYHGSAAAAGPAKWDLRRAFIGGTYAALLRGVQERGAAAERARAADADRRLQEVRHATSL